MKSLALFLLSLPLLAQHAVYLSAQWQDDSQEIFNGNTVSIVFQRSTVSGGPYSTIATLPASSAQRQTYTYADIETPSNPLVAGTTYYYVAYAIDSNNNSSALTSQLAVTIPTLYNGGHRTLALQ